MKISKELLQKYAALIVRTGANVRPGQVVELTISVERHEFAALLIEECYRAGAKKVKIAKNTTLKKTIGRLAKGKTYYVRVRAYKKVGKTTYYSEWSDTKAVKIRQ